MALVSDDLKTCGVRINAWVGGVPSSGSGVVYVTPTYCDYDYILTARHIFQEEASVTYDEKKVYEINIYYSDRGEFKLLEKIKQGGIRKKLILFEEDFAIIIISKDMNRTFPQILVKEELDDEDESFFSWAIFSANQDELHKFDLKRNDKAMKRFKLSGNLNFKYLSGMSGAGVFLNNKRVLHGIIYKYPNIDFQNETVDCTQISFIKINQTLSLQGKVPLDTHTSSHKREINDEVVDIHQAFVNEVCLDLELARQRLKFDIEDDWFHDPLKYVDLLNQEYLFKQFENFFGKKDYQATEAERFFVPKKNFTLRQALVSPFIDRIMYMATVGVLAEKLDGAMIPNVYSARYNKYSKGQLILNGVEQWKKMKYKLAECVNLKDHSGRFAYGCVVEIDLLNFYDNVNKKLLVKKILRVCDTTNEKKAAQLLYDMLVRFSNKALGLPQNSDASSILASFYLNQVDVFMFHHTAAYYRFMDDIKIFCRNKYEARKILQAFESELRRCHLSVNSQKTEITTLNGNDVTELASGEKRRTMYQDCFDLRLNKIAKLRSSANYAYINDAFHDSINLLNKSFDDDLNCYEDKTRVLNYALNTIAVLAKKGIATDSDDFRETMEIAIESLKDNPWITTQVCKVLNLLPTEIAHRFLDILKPIVLDDNYNIYSFQTYQIWLLLAKHKCSCPELMRYAVAAIEKNDDSNRAVIAAMTIYMCSIDFNYKRVILRKFSEGYTHKYFQNRSALISLRSYPTDIIDADHIDGTLKGSHEFTYRYKNKDLVFIQGAIDGEEEDEDGNVIEQLYSI